MNLILFDCDGTIVDSQHIIVAAMETAFAGADLAPPHRAAILSVVGLSLIPAITQLLPDPAHHHHAHALAESYKGAFQHLRRDPAHYEPLYPGARHTIATLAERGDCVLGIATGKSRRGVDVLLERENLSGLFATIQTADTHPSKPHPSMITTACAETGTDANHVIMIGDTTYDMEMACAAGVIALGVAWGYHDSAALTAAGASTVVADYAELIPTLDRFFATKGRS